nr:high mobility group B protein 4-like [Ipomoea batatas]
MTMKGEKSKAGSGKTEKLAIRKQKVKRVKDPNKPKRPPSAFLLFISRKINTASPRPANSRSIEEDEGDQSEEEMSLPPLRLVRDLKPYDG